MNLMRRLVFFIALAGHCSMRRLVPSFGEGDRLFQSIMQAACLLPGVTGNYARRALLYWMTDSRTDCDVYIGTDIQPPESDVRKFRLHRFVLQHRLGHH